MKPNESAKAFGKAILAVAVIVLLALPAKGFCGSANGGFWWMSDTLPYDTELSYSFDVAVYPEGIFLDNLNHTYAYVTAENKHIEYNGVPYGVETVTAYFNNNAEGGYVFLYNYDDTNRFTNAWIATDSDVNQGWNLSTLATEGYLTTETNGAGEAQKFLRVQEETIFISESTNPVQSTWENRYYFYNFTRQQWDQKMQNTFVISASREAVSAATAQTGDGEWAGILETSGDTNDIDHGTPPVKRVCYMNRSVQVVNQGTTNVVSLIDSSVNGWEPASTPYQTLYLTETNNDQFVLGWNGSGLFITTNPANALVAPGGAATFTVSAIGSALNYQWFEDGVAISGATNASYTTPTLSGSSSGSSFDVVVSSGQSFMTSSVATVTVAESQVLGWGATNAGCLNIPAGLTNAVALAAGPNFALALKSDGSVTAWGDNSYGETKIPKGLKNVSQISAGYYNCLALGSNGVVTAWGADYWGISRVPKSLSTATTPSQVIAVAAGGRQCLALRSNGTVIGWGDTSSADGSPAIVPKGLSNVVSISSGQTHSLALKSDGTVVAWGDNTYGQSSVPAGLSNVVSIAAGNCYSLALKSDGTVVAWGDNTYGETSLPAGLSNVVSISAGSAWCSLALTRDGTPVTWGMAGTQTLAPPSDMGGVASIAAGGYFALAIQQATPLSITESVGLRFQKKSRRIG